VTDVHDNRPSGTIDITFLMLIKKINPLPVGDKRILTRELAVKNPPLWISVLHVLPLHPILPCG
jgi:hypothetical protein